MRSVDQCGRVVQAGRVVVWLFGRWLSNTAVCWRSCGLIVTGSVAWRRRSPVSERRRSLNTSTLYSSSSTPSRSAPLTVFSAPAQIRFPSTYQCCCLQASWSWSRGIARPLLSGLGLAEVFFGFAYITACYLLVDSLLYSRLPW